jgi:8-oxo-dGTP pyrophosphatase MutT (NUDIX family)
VASVAKNNLAGYHVSESRKNYNMNMMLLDFESRLNSVLTEEFNDDFFAAVGIVQCGDKFLLGLAKNTSDDRSGKWVFPGGGAKKNESAKKAAEREVWEETGVKCKAAGEPFNLPRKKGVAFVHCKARSGQNLNNNHEFSALGWFTRREMKSLKLYDNVLTLLDRVR